MTNIHIPITIIAILIIQVHSTTLLPIQSTNQYQWEYNYWTDCTTNLPITPTNCQNNEQNWMECYLVPSNGLCYKQNIKQNSSNQTYFQFTFYDVQSETQATITINDKTTTKQLSISKQKTQVVQIVDQFSSITQIIVKATNLMLSKLVVSTDCLPNCKQCSDTVCSDCNDNYFLYNSVCTNSNCLNEVGQLTTKTLTSSEGSINSNNVYTAKLNFNVSLGNCLIPKVYLTKSLLDSSVTQILKEEQITLSDKSLTLTLNMEQITQCQQINTDQLIVYQCFIGVAITYEQVTQYLLVLVAQISIDKSTTSALATTQPVIVPDTNDNSVVGSFTVVNQVINTKVNVDKRLITTTQVISDPTYQNYKLQFQEAQVSQGNNVYSLDLVQMEGISNGNTYTLQWNDGQFDPSQDYELTVVSLLSQVSRRILTKSRSTMNIDYNASMTLKVQNDSSSEDRRISWYYILICVIAGLFATISMAYLCSVINEKTPHGNDSQTDKNLVKA